MQELKLRKENCRRDSAQQTEQVTNCVQKSQRIRCCGRVFSEQEAHDQGKHMENCQSRHMENGQGKRKENCQGKHMANRQGRGRNMTNRQGKCMA